MVTVVVFIIIFFFFLITEYFYRFPRKRRRGRLHQEIRFWGHITRCVRAAGTKIYKYMFCNVYNIFFSRLPGVLCPLLRGSGTREVRKINGYIIISCM